CAQRKPEKKEKGETGTESAEKSKGKGKDKPRPVRNIYLVRHGQYEMKEKDEDCKLTALGREQAKLAGQRINQLTFKLDKIFYSTMTRATETAKIIMGEMKDVPANESCDMTREGCPIRPEPDIWGVPTDADYFEDGARIEGAFRKYFYRPDPDQKETSHEMIVCHGNVIRYFVCRALQVPPEYWLRMGVANCSITHITITASGRVSIRALGDVGHVPADKQTFT
ncbi:serine/threonine-protein phosphatase PGAM5, mitochondrial, partial [Sphaeroforma arctica JP610]